MSKNDWFSTIFFSVALFIFVFVRNRIQGDSYLDSFVTASWLSFFVGVGSVIYYTFVK